MTNTNIMHSAKLFYSVLICILFLSFLGCSDDEDSRLEDTGLCLVEVDGVFQEVDLDEKPKYLGGEINDFYSKIVAILKYPAEARENGIEGDCILIFEISKEGIVENVVAIQDPGGGIVEASIEAFTSVAEGVVFTPGILNGVPVSVKKELLIKFRLEG